MPDQKSESFRSAKDKQTIRGTKTGGATIMLYSTYPAEIKNVEMYLSSYNGLSISRHKEWAEGVLAGHGADDLQSGPGTEKMSCLNTQEN